MSTMIDIEYVGLLANRLERFKQVRSRLWICRCPICGDSEKKKSLRRFYIYFNTKRSGVDHLSVNCFNCGYQAPFGKFLQEFDPGMYQEYRLDVFKEKGWGTGKASPEPEKPQEPIEECPGEAVTPDSLDLPTLADLPGDHFARKYVESRRLPVWTYEYLMFSENFKEQLGDFPSFASLADLPDGEGFRLPEDSRLIIPFYNEWGELRALQGRSLDPKSKLRYLTLKRDETDSKVFGLDRVDRSRMVLVVEGPIDSLFLPNCIATADADLMSAGFGDLFIFDGQPRNAEVMKRLLKAINAGKRVVIPPDNFPHKDVNDMVKDGGMSTRELIEFIGKYSYQGLSARMRFSKYCPLNTSSW